MFSSQYGREFQRLEYDKLKKVYSIWVCTNPPDDYKNSINRYYMQEELLKGGKPRKRENYDKMCIVMIGLGGTEQKNYDGIIKFLSTLLSAEIKPEDKKRILEQNYNVTMSKEMMEEAEVMCNLSQGILQTGIQQGITQGIAYGKELGIGEKAKDMALALFAMDISVAKISLAAKVPIEQVEAWIAEAGLK